MRLPVVLMSVVVLGVVAGCGDDGSDQARGDGATAEERTNRSDEREEQEHTRAVKFSGQDRRNYADAKAVCASFPARKVARDLGLDVDVRTSKGLVRIAEKYAADYRPSFRQAVFEGCLDGLPNP